ncbi:MAG: hypothetical protein HC860_24565 [Alkalinema sp. RU_4_3]|nr:hypothetical protein [Alkalinema sp. RU_4_3]
MDQSFEDGDTFISKLRLSNQDFGPLVFVGVPVNPDLVSESVTENRSTAVQVLVADRDGVPKFVLQASRDQTVVPVGIRTFTSAFDRLELSQIGDRQTVISRFDGIAYLPTVEVLRSGSRGNFSYGWSGGAWWNASPNVSPNVVRNDFGDVEKKLGLYGNGLLSWSSTKVVQEKNVVKRVTSHSTGVRLAVNQNGRWAPHLSYMREVVRAGLIGAVQSVHVNLHWDHTWTAGTPFENIGDLVLYDFGIHWFDFVSSLVGDRARRITATRAFAVGQTMRVPMLAQVLLELEGGQASLVFDAHQRFGARDTTYVGGSQAASSVTVPV